ncbi:hypothetical protein MAUB1S_04752 [Mycolicibacterium aubagnense]
MFTISAEADHLVGAIEFGNIPEHLAIAGIKPTQDAIEAEDHVDGPQLGLDILERSLGGLDHAQGLCDGQDHAVVYGAEEG